MSSNIHFVGRGPSPLGYNGAVGCPNATVQKRSGLERDAWRCSLNQVDVVCDIPCVLMVYYPIVLQEVLGRWCPEQEHEIVISVLGCKCTSDESVDEDISRCESLRARKVS